MKKAFTLVELMIIVAIIGLLAAIVIPAFTKSKTEAEKRKELSPAAMNDWLVEQASFKKVLEFKGFDIYTFYANGETRCVAIPVTNSVYDLERK
jgi:prepilin-type N-terminal cleavage/methylation domain-containing protein